MTGITIDSHQIRGWAESRGAKPVLTAEPDDVPAPAIRFPEQDIGSEVSWDQWLARFEAGLWAFIWQDTTQDGQPSRFYRLVQRFSSSPQAR
jgi:hypothetical protein